MESNNRDRAEQLNGLDWSTGDLDCSLRRDSKGSQADPKCHFALPKKHLNAKVCFYLAVESIHCKVDDCLSRLGVAELGALTPLELASN